MGLRFPSVLPAVPGAASFPADPPAVSKHRLPLPTGAFAIPPCQLPWLLAWCSQPCCRGKEEDWLRCWFFFLHQLFFFPKGCFVFCFFSTPMVGCSRQGELPFSPRGLGQSCPLAQSCLSPISAGTQGCIALHSSFFSPKTTRASQNAPGTGTRASRAAALCRVGFSSGRHHFEDLEVGVSCLLPPAGSPGSRGLWGAIQVSW